MSHRPLSATVAIMALVSFAATTFQYGTGPVRDLNVSVLVLVDNLVC